jgi:hypothetical protein
MRFVAINRAWLQVRVFRLVDGSDWLEPCTGERPGTSDEIWSLDRGKDITWKVLGFRVYRKKTDPAPIYIFPLIFS